MLYLRAVDDAALTHATDSTAMPAPLCNNATGRTRLDFQETSDYDSRSGTSVLRRLPIEVQRAADVTCPACRALLAPEKIRILAITAEAAEPEISAPAAADVPQPRRRLRRTT